MIMGLKILIVEDDLTQSLILKTSLRKKGYECINSFNGIQALEKLNHEHVDLVISDIDMDKMNGLELKEEINKNKEWREIPFIFLTGNVSTKNKAMDLGAQLFLVKPYTNIIDEIDKFIKFKIHM